MRIVVFGGSQPKEGSQPYTDARILGGSLALLGHTVMTGGYSGTMEAVSRGAAEAGGHVIGVTCGQIERSHNRTVNRWVAEERKSETLLERLKELTGSCDAALALPGGPGTLTEIALMWNLMIVGSIAEKPLILIGEGWAAVISEMLVRLGDYTPESHRRLLRFALTPDIAVESLRALQ
jgi:uncharacterized protein (TIGR00725 family)